MTSVTGSKSYILVFKTIRPLYTGTLTWNSKIKRVDEKAAKNQIKTAQVGYFEEKGKKV